VAPSLQATRKQLHAWLAIFAQPSGSETTNQTAPVPAPAPLAAQTSSLSGELAAV
jgi:hypothetical protein